jgi:hypothetical protein
MMEFPPFDDTQKDYERGIASKKRSEAAGKIDNKHPLMRY